LITHELPEHEQIRCRPDGT